MAFVKRVQKLSKASLQVKIILAFLLVASVSALFQVYLLNRFALVVSRELPTDGHLLLSHLPNMLSTSLALTFAVLIPGTFLVGLLVTHRVAGPVYAIERYLERHLEGREQGPCRVRKGDELQELCELVNRTVGIDEATGEGSGQASAPSASSSSAAA